MGRSWGQRDFPKTVLIIYGSCDNYFVVFEDFDIVFFENSYAIIIVEWSDRDERYGGETVNNVALLCLLGLSGVQRSSDSMCRGHVCYVCSGYCGSRIGFGDVGAWFGMLAHYVMTGCSSICYYFL